jgi:hypothetical protein
MKPSDIQRNAEAQIINKQIYADQINRVPFKGGPLDMRLVKDFNNAYSTYRV